MVSKEKRKKNTYWEHFSKELKTISMDCKRRMVRQEGKDVNELIETNAIKKT